MVGKITKKINTFYNLMRERQIKLALFSLLKPLIPIYAKIGTYHLLIRDVQKKVKVVVIGSHGVGQSAFMYWLYCLGIKRLPITFAEGRLTFFKTLLSTWYRIADRNSKDKFAFLNDYVYHGSRQYEYMKQFHFDASVLSVCLVRDPIAVLKSHINHHLIFPKDRVGYLSWDRQMIVKQASKVYFENYDAENFLKMKGDNRALPSLSPDIKSCLEATFKGNCLSAKKGFLITWLHFTTNLKMFETMCERGLSNVWFIDIKELMGNRAIDTMKKVGGFLGLDKPKEFYNQFGAQISGAIDECLPHICYFGKDSGVAVEGGGQIILTSKKYIAQNYFANYTQVPNSLLNSWGGGNKYKELVFLLNGDNQVEILNHFIKNPQEFDKIINYFNIYLEALETKLQEIVTLKITENDVLEWLRNHKEEYLHLKKILEYEVSAVEQYAPDIVKSWGYYQEFLNLKFD